jgi:hypothetical protein
MLFAIETDLYFTCNKCNNELTATDQYGDSIDIEPCVHCLKDAREEKNDDM